MSNVHGLFSGKKEEGDDDSHSDDDENNRYVGGIGDHGGGSGLAVQPNASEMTGGGARDHVFGMADEATSDDNARVRRTITMYRDGFVVDDGPYRRLDDPANAEFLRSLAAGQTPRELSEEAAASGGNVVVGLVDKRGEDYVEKFKSFSGEGKSLGTTTSSPSAAAGGPDAAPPGVFHPDALSEDPPPLDDGRPATSIQVRLLSGQRRVIRINASSTVRNVAEMLRSDAAGGPFRLVSGFPPKPLQDPTLTVKDAGLMNAQVSMQKA